MMSTDEAETLTAPLQVLLTPTARARFVEQARQRHLPPGVLLRVIVLDWLTTAGEKP